MVLIHHGWERQQNRLCHSEGACNRGYSHHNRLGGRQCSRNHGLVITFKGPPPVIYIYQLGLTSHSLPKEYHHLMNKHLKHEAMKVISGLNYNNLAHHKNIVNVNIEKISLFSFQSEGSTIFL